MSEPANPDNNPPTPTPTPAPKPEVFSREYVTELRQESASYRTKAQELEAATKTATEAATKAQQEADAKVTATEKAANDRIIRAELKAEAIKAGMIDLDGLKLADLSKVSLNDKGEVVGAEEMLKDLKELKPYLFSNPQSSSNPNPPPAPKPNEPKHASEMTKEEYAAARRSIR